LNEQEFDELADKIFSTDHKIHQQCLDYHQLQYNLP